LRIASPAISRVGNGGWLVGVDRAELRFQKPPVDRPRQLYQRVVHVDDLVKPRAEQILLAGLPSLAWSHRKSPLYQPEREESRLVIRGNPQNRFARKSRSNGQNPANSIT
jgi:hypothetical protein